MKFCKSTTKLMEWRSGLLGEVGFLLIVVVNCFTSCQSHSVIHLESAAPLSSNSSLEYHLCHASDQLEQDTELVLSPGVHFIKQGSPCIIQNINNLLIRGMGRIDINTGSQAEIQCSSNFIGRNFIFLNITNLHIENVIIVNCGQMIPDDLPS